MLFLNEIRKVSKETPVPRDSKNRPQKFFKKNADLQAMKKNITRLPNNILVEFAG
jgi:hypothetical protein